MHIPFTESVRIRSILLKLGIQFSSQGTISVALMLVTSHPGRGEVTPRHLRIYANRSTIVDFAEAENSTPQLNITLSEGEIGVAEYPLRASAFANVHSLSLFFVGVKGYLRRHSLTRILQSEAVGGECVQIYYIGFRGDSRSQRKDVSEKLEIPAANAADARIIDRLAERTGGVQTTAR